VKYVLNVSKYGFAFEVAVLITFIRSGGAFFTAGCNEQLFFKPEKILVQIHAVVFEKNLKIA